MSMETTEPDDNNLEEVAAGDGAATGPVGETAPAQDEALMRLQDDLRHTQEQLLRTMADFQNFRKRQQEESAKIRQFATENLVTVLLPVLDNFERTLAHGKAGASLEQLIEGIGAVERQLRSALESQNVKRIETVGQPFDPNVHEAIGMEASEEFGPDTVTLEIEAGYRMGDKVIRPARVKVSAG